MSEKVVFERTKGLSDTPMRYCAGCLHGVIHRMIGEVMEELDIIDRSVGVCPVGCAVFMYEYMACDMIEAAHGRAPAVATGVKRMLPENIVWTYQGDGDLAAIGTAEIIHAAARGEKITTIFINNTTYGMTGGQLAPTTLIGQKATTCPGGRDPQIQGYPIKVCELLSSLDGVVYLERVAPTSPAGINKTKKAIKKAFENQLNGRGFSLVEVLSSCPTQLHMDPVECLKWIDEKMAAHYPIGVYVDRQE